MATAPKVAGYWTATVLVAVPFGLGGLSDLRHVPSLLGYMQQVGYPGAFVAVVTALQVFLGAWRVAAAGLVVGPWFAGKSAWIYGAIAADLSLVALSHGAEGPGALGVVAPLVMLTVLGASWVLRESGRVLPSHHDDHHDEGDSHRRFASCHHL